MLLVILILLINKKISNNDFNKNKANTVSPSQSFAFGKDLFGQIAGAIGQFEVQTKDPFGNNCTIDNTNLVWSLTFTDSQNHLVNSSFNTTYQNNGKYLISYNITTSGNFELQIYINGTLINGNPWNNTIIPSKEKKV